MVVTVGCGCCVYVLLKSVVSWFINLLRRSNPIVFGCVASWSLVADKIGLSQMMMSPSLVALLHLRSSICQGHRGLIASKVVSWINWSILLKSLIQEHLLVCDRASLGSFHRILLLRLFSTCLNVDDHLLVLSFDYFGLSEYLGCCGTLVYSRVSSLTWLRVVENNVVHTERIISRMVLLLLQGSQLWSKLLNLIVFLQKLYIFGLNLFLELYFGFFVLCFLKSKLLLDILRFLFSLCKESLQIFDLGL